VPVCTCPTLGIIKTFPLDPILVVVIPMLEDIPIPWNDHDMSIGSSPSGTMQLSWAKEPSFMMLVPNDNGRIAGGTKKKFL